MPTPRGKLGPRRGFDVVFVVGIMLLVSSGLAAAGITFRDDWNVLISILIGACVLAGLAFMSAGIVRRYRNS